MLLGGILTMPIQPTYAQQSVQTTSGTAYWSKTAYSKSAFSADKYQCLQAAIAQSKGNNSNISVQPNFDPLLMEMQNRDALFSACMEAKGYTLQTGLLPRSGLAETPPPSLKATQDNLAPLAAYCLGYHKEAKKFLDGQIKDHPDDDAVKGRKLARDAIRNEIIQLEKHLSTRGLYSSNGKHISPSIAEQMAYGKQDYISVRDQNISGASESRKCRSSCLESKEKDQTPVEQAETTLACLKSCDQYNSEEEKRLSRCSNIHTQQP